MRGLEEMDIDEVVDVPDTPDRLAAERVLGRESLGRDGGSSIAGTFRGRDTLNESRMNGLMAKNKPFTQNGHCRKPPIIHPPKSFSNPRTANFVSSNVLPSSENSFAPENHRLHRKVAVAESHGHRGNHAGGLRIVDKGKSILTDKSFNYQNRPNFCDLTKLNGYAEKPESVCPNSEARDKGKGKMASSGSSNGDTPKGPRLATVDGVAVNLSPDSQHKTGELSSLAVSLPRVTGRKNLVRNGCISPQNIAKAELRKSGSSNIERNHIASEVSDFKQPSRDLTTQENDRGRMKGKAVLTIPASKEQGEKNFSGTSSSFATDTREANGIINAQIGGWRSTHSHLGKPDNIIPDVAEGLSRRIGGIRGFSHQEHENRLGRRENRPNHQVECDNAEGEAAAQAASTVREAGQSSGRPHLEKIVSKRLKKQGSTSTYQSGCSTSASEDPDFMMLGPSRESMMTRSYRAQYSQSRDSFCPVIEVDEFSPPVRPSTSQSIDSANDDDADARARQVEADEILARELQEQLYYETPIVARDELTDVRGSRITNQLRQPRPEQSRPTESDEISEQLAWALQQADDAYESFGARQSASHASDTVIPNLLRQPRTRPAQTRANRTPSQPNRRATVARVANSPRMAQLRGGRASRPRRPGSQRVRNLQFPLHMDLDMRLDILEALEATFANYQDDNSIYQVQRDFNENDYEMLLALDDHNHQHAGASLNQINSLPQSVVQTDNQEACTICLETPTIGETVRHLPCLHKFHKDCIDPWLSRKTSCPVCKCSIT